MQWVGWQMVAQATGVLMQERQLVEETTWRVEGEAMRLAVVAE